MHLITNTHGDKIPHTTILVLAPEDSYGYYTARLDTNSYLWATSLLSRHFAFLQTVSLINFAI